MENLDSRVTRLEDKLDSLSAKVEQHTQTLELHTQTLEQHTQTLEQHTQTLAQHTEKLDRIEARQARTDDLISHLIQSVNTTFERFERQIIAHIDMRYESLRSDMRAFKDELADHGRRIPALEATAESQDRRLGILERRVS
ncbi:MAG: hypothetical protein KF760_08320 [Candidatus Eremiobacteraeota bacterium]|nr:hypothetical protein [Candidatus Eremiobacteraeota bacterium]MCW5870770.1 hypothetical protein [Candidatus Eremiobacteraeota bacterium]